MVGRTTFTCPGNPLVGRHESWYSQQNTGQLRSIYRKQSYVFCWEKDTRWHVSRMQQIVQRQKIMYLCLFDWYIYTCMHWLPVSARIYTNLDRSWTVTHPCTNRAQRCLTSVSRRNNHNTTPHSQPTQPAPHSQRNGHAIEFSYETWAVADPGPLVRATFLGR